MSIYSVFWQVISSSFIFVAGIILSTKMAKFFNHNQKRSLYIYFWHTAWCLVYSQYVESSGGDAVGYYLNSFDLSSIEFSLGTESIWYFVHIFSSVLNLSIIGVFLIFNIFGFIGLLAFDACLKEVTIDKTKFIRRFTTLIIFLPSASFWSSAIGKDAISFMATGLALWAALNFKSRIWLLAVAVLLMLIVRPHMAGLMVLSFAASLIFMKRLSFATRAVLSVLALVVSIILVPFALSYSGATESDNLNDYFEQRQGYNLEGGGAVDIASMSFAEKLFTYLFRPLPHEAESLFALAASIDNLALLLLVILSVKNIFRKSSLPVRVNAYFLWLYCISAWIILSLTTANLGISVRQKWMFVPVMIYLLVSWIGRASRKQ